MSGDDARSRRRSALHAAAAERILVLDGSWGARIQELALTEEDFRGARFAAHPSSLRGDTDLLCLTRPDVVSELSADYLDAGADIITTNTFTATTIAQADYDMAGSRQRDQHRGRPAVARGRRPLRGRRLHARPALGRRFDRPDQPDAVALARRRGPGRARRRLRRGL
jgi:hypothetical protein